MIDDLQNLQDLIRRLGDLRRYGRRDWAAVCRGSKREGLRATLLAIADQRGGTRQDECCLRKAAHAVLPLHGPALQALCQLLVDERPASSEYADALVMWLSERGDHEEPARGPVIEALRQAAREAKDELDQKRMTVLLRQAGAPEAQSAGSPAAPGAPQTHPNRKKRSR